MKDKKSIAYFIVKILSPYEIATVTKNFINRVNFIPTKKVNFEFMKKLITIPAIYPKPFEINIGIPICINVKIINIVVIVFTKPIMQISQVDYS